MASRLTKFGVCYPNTRFFLKKTLPGISANRQCSQYTVLPRARYGGRQTVTLVPGDGIGPDLGNHVKEVFRYAGAPVDFEEIDLKKDNCDQQEIENTLLAIKRNGVCLKGNIETDIENPSFRSVNIELRTRLDLFAHVMHCKSVPGIEAKHHNIDIIVIRENTEGEYSNLEHEFLTVNENTKNVTGVVESLKIITREKSTRIARFAFEEAARLGRKKVTAVHKANIMKLGDGLFLESCRKVSEDYPDIEFEGMIVDNASMQMVSKPQQFDVMVMPNLYGNIIGNIAAGLIGGPGVVAGKNIGGQYAIFETGTRNSGRSIAGKNIANPMGMLFASADMLQYMGYDQHSKKISKACNKILCDLKIHTPDLGGQHSTSEVVQAVIKELQSKDPNFVQ